MKPDLPNELLVPFGSLAEHLRDVCRDHSVYYFGNPGNWGDALIREGTLRLLQDNGITHNEIFINQKFVINPGSVLIYGGGGAWCRLWDHSPEILNRIGKRFDRTVVLPSTFEGHYSIPDTDFYARDRFESLAVMPEARFCHDMAFYIGNIELPAGKGEGYFFRSDAESAGSFPLPDGNIDLSALGTHMTPVQPFFERLARLETVHTDRLHVAIAAALLHRRLYFYPGAYFKNYAVYRSSLEGFFDDVHFLEAPSPATP